MPIRSLLIANRGEIAIRIARAAADLGIGSVAVYSQDDAESLHTRIADEAVALDARGVPAYLDIEAIVAAAVAAGCDAVHPGYGFLAENAALARACAHAGITFVGPSIANLELFGDKGRARAAAADSDVPTIPGIDGAVTQDAGPPTSSSRSASAGRSCSRPWPAAAGAALAPCRIPPTWPRRSSAAARRRRAPSATAPCTSSSTCRGRATSRCRSSATGTGPSPTWASASARCSAATRRSSRSRRRRTCPPTCATASPTRPSASRRTWPTTTSAPSSSWSTRHRWVRTRPSSSSRPTPACRSSTP